MRQILSRFSQTIRYGVFELRRQARIEAVFNHMVKPDPATFLLIGIFCCACGGLLLFGRKLRLFPFSISLAAITAFTIYTVEALLDMPVSYSWFATMATLIGFLILTSRSYILAEFASKAMSMARNPGAVSVLLFGCGLVAVVYAWAKSDAPVHDELAGEPELQQPRDLQLVDGLRATTDRGNDVPLYRLANASAATVAKGDERLVAAKAQRENLIRTAEPSAQTNCHGWVFAGGLCWLSNDSVEVILMENGYQRVEIPASGDVVVYRDDSGRPVHSGLVRSVWSEGRILIESKWGPLGSFVHFVEQSVYTNEWTFHRTQRPSHLLRGLPQSSDASARLNPKG